MASVIDKKKLRELALKFYDEHAQHGESTWGFFVRMGYGFHVQLKSINRRTNRWCWNPPPSPGSRKEVCVMITSGTMLRVSRRYWIRVPRDIAQKALVFGCFVSLNESF